jgi:hypothetical protein
MPLFAAMNHAVLHPHLGLEKNYSLLHLDLIVFVCQIQKFLQEHYPSIPFCLLPGGLSTFVLG